MSLLKWFVGWILVLIGKRIEKEAVTPSPEAVAPNKQEPGPSVSGNMSP
jgi:hypothetical protein